MLKHNRREFLKLLGVSGLSLAMPLPGSAKEMLPILKPIPSSGEKLPVIGLGTSRVFEVGPGDFEREGPVTSWMRLLIRCQRANTLLKLFVTTTMKSMNRMKTITSIPERSQ